MPAELANQHNVAIVPVGLTGTFKLKDILKLPLTTKPKVSIRFGAPIHVRGRSLSEVTADLQVRVEQRAGVIGRERRESKHRERNGRRLDVAPHADQPTCLAKNASVRSRASFAAAALYEPR